MTEQEKFELAQYAGSGILELDFLDELDDLDSGVRQLIFGQYDKGIVSGNEIKDNPFESVKRLLAVARIVNPKDKDEVNKVWHCQRDLVSLFFLTYETEKYFSLLEQQDKEWLITIARTEGGLWKEAQVVLLVGMNINNHLDKPLFESTPEEQKELFDLLVKDEIPGWEEYGEDQKLQAYHLLRIYTDLNLTGLLMLFTETYNVQVNNTEGRNLDEYLAEIGRAELLTIDEELELVKAVQEKGVDCEEMKRLEKANARFVVSVANQHQDKGLTIWELIEAGTEGLRKAALKYDLKADYKFMAYAVWWVRQAILQAICEKD